MDVIGTHYKVNMYFLSAIGLWPYTKLKIRIPQNILVTTVLWTSVISQIRRIVTKQRSMVFCVFIAILDPIVSKYSNNYDISIMYVISGNISNNDDLSFSTQNGTFWKIMPWFQLLTFLTVQYTMHLFLKNVPNIIVTLAYTLKYAMFRYQLNPVKKLMEQIKSDWNSLNVEAEFAIIKKHTEMGKQYTQSLAVFVYPSALIIILMQFLPDILDVAVPLNESRPRQILFTIEAFCDQQKYFYLLALAVCIVVIVGATTFIATESVFFSWMQHAVGMFEIVSYRIKETVTLNSMKRELCKSKSGVGTFANALEAHKRASKFYQYMKQKYLPWYLILILLGIISMSFNLFRLSQVLIFRTDIREVFDTAILIFSGFGYMYYWNYVIQRALDSSRQIFQESYNSIWYEAPVDTQKQLLFVMTYNVESVNFNMYGFYDASIEGFGTIVKVSLSYFMILNSVQ